MYIKLEINMRKDRINVMAEDIVLQYGRWEIQMQPRDFLPIVPSTWIRLNKTKELTMTSFHLSSPLGVLHSGCSPVVYAEDPWTLNNQPVC